MNNRCVYKILVIGWMVFMLSGSAAAVEKTTKQNIETNAVEISTKENVEIKNDIRIINQQNQNDVKLRADVLDEMQKLITFSENASSDIRRAVKDIKAQQDKRIKIADNTSFLGLADKYDEFAHFLKGEKYRLSRSSRVFTDLDLQFLEDMAEKMKNDRDKMGNFEVQEMMSRATQARNLASSIQKDLDKAKETLINKVGGEPDDPDD